MVHHPEDPTPTAPDDAFIFGPAGPPPQDEPALPEADLWQVLMARWVGPASPDSGLVPEPPVDIWW
jgi:hypothetical protein